MGDDEKPDLRCAVCDRRLLPGERALDFVTGDGVAIVVCELCKPRAEAAGWLRTHEYEELRGAAPARDRRRARGAGALSGLLSRFGAAPEEQLEERHQPRREATPAEAAEQAYESDPGPAAEPDLSASERPGTTIPQALAAFNHSDHRRTVAGLTRTLGAPRATAFEITNADGLSAVRLTVAWEITWYQWEVGPSGRSHEVRESAKGDTIDQLRSDDRAWNVMVDADGTLQQRSSPATVAGG